MALIARFGTRISEVRSADCTATEQVGNLVYISGEPVAGRDQVRRADPKNYGKLPAVGVVISKPTSTTCLVQWVGETPPIFSGLSPGETHFLGLDGDVVDIPPLPTGYGIFIQPVGKATSSSRLYVSPSDNLLGRIPL